jgi:hypothetical protein
VKRGIGLREGEMGTRKRNVVKGGGKVGRLRVRKEEGLRKRKGESAGKRRKG